MDFFRGRYSWRKLSDLIRRLPSSSLTTEAMAEDDELAEQWVNAPESPATGPRLSEYSPEAARLDLISDRIAELISVMVRLNGNKAPRVKPARRPETAIDRARKRLVERRVSSLIDEVMDAQQRWAETHQN